MNKDFKKELNEILECISKLNPKYDVNRDTSICFDGDKYAVQLRVFTEENRFGLDIVLQENLEYENNPSEEYRDYSDVERFRFIEGDLKDYKTILNEDLISNLILKMKEIFNKYNI